MRLAKVVLLSVVSCAAWAQRPGGQAAPADPKKLCGIEGRTVNARTGEPVPRVSLSLVGSGQNAAGKTAKSGNDGRFVIENITPGTYRLIGERVGYLRQGYGSTTPGGSGAPLNLSEGQQLKGLEFRLTPQGVILGQVFDEDGDPIPRASVAAYPVGGTAQTGPVGGMRGGAGQFGQAAGSSVLANDIGEFRIAGLGPGRYHVVATSQGVGAGRGMSGRGSFPEAQEQEPGQAPMPTYYPSTTDSAAAVPLEVAPGQETGGINITVRKGLLFRIQGKIVGGNPQDVTSVVLSLSPRAALGAPLGRAGGGQVRPDASFEIARVQPGSYYLLAQRMGRGGPGLVAKTMVDVTTADITGLIVPLTEPISLSGTVKIEGQQAAGLPRMTLSLSSTDGLAVGAPAARVTDAGAFTMASVFPDRYSLNVSGLPEGSYLKSLRMAGQEILEKGLDLSPVRSNVTLDVLLSLKGATLEGTVTLDDKPATGSYVAVLADPLRVERPYLNKFATADQDGRFTIKGLAPGNYKIYAFQESMPQLSRQPGLATPYERRAAKIDLNEDATGHIDLKPIKPEDAQQ